ncbi:TIGR02300 family protein [Aureimonas glaciei]|jgi:uncharacterized protein (TIGR02300 family)|uniref:TIGR02300 family protein n=1 Tax=Aureimonas glaciei TaxID=1776957 RepID=A0A916XS01_9HYPH|nr:TIGR02300 family protein [Aureimonas glaciei]GGD02142.1 TIGR02300 family protein [Aureimonas glaciei]
MANPELGTKRICPETGRKFYDLNKDPIVSPYTGTSYPVSFFEIPARAKRGAAAVVPEAEAEVPEVADDAEDAPETVSLTDIEEDEEVAVKKDTIDIDDDEDEEVEADDADTFLEPDEDEDDDMTDIIGSRDDDDD